MTRSTLLLAAGCGLLLPAAVPAAFMPPEEGSVSYFSTFDNKSLKPEFGNSSLNISTGATPRFYAVNATDLALVADFHGWTAAGGQSALKTNETEWTIAFRAQTGTRPHNLIFAFGTTDNGSNVDKGPGGLAFRRGANPETLEITLGMDTNPVLTTDTGAADGNAGRFHAYALTCKDSRLTLYRDKVPVGTFDNSEKKLPVIPTSHFQWGERYGKNNLKDETGAENVRISYLGIWHKALTEEQIAEADIVAQIPEPEPATSVATDIHAPAAYADLLKTLPKTAHHKALMDAESYTMLNDRAHTEQFSGPRRTLAAVIDGPENPQDPRSIYAIKELGTERAKDDSAQNIVTDTCIIVRSGKLREIHAGSSVGNGSTRIKTMTGTTYTEVREKASVHSVVGAQTGAEATSSVNSVIAIDGELRGFALGGVWSRYPHTATLNGSTHIVCRSVQTEPDALVCDWGSSVSGLKAGLVGGSAPAQNPSGAKQNGNTSVEVELPKDASGTFNKSIVGGSVAYRTYDWFVRGNTSVTIDAPAAVTFAAPIVGGSLYYGSAADRPNADITGDSSLTLKGGTYKSWIAAGGSGKCVRIRKRADGTGGTATLTIAGPCVFDNTAVWGCTNGSTAENGAELKIAADTDFSKARLLDGFDRIVLDSGCRWVRLGRHRFGSAAVSLRTVVRIGLDPTPEEIAAGRVVLGKMADPDGLKNLAPWEGVPRGWVPQINAQGELMLARPAGELSWQNTPTESSWSDGFRNGFKNGDSAILANFGPDGSPLPTAAALNGSLTAGRVTVQPNHDFTLKAPGSLAADALDISGRFAVSENIGVRYLRFEILERPTKTPTTDPSHKDLADGLALAELMLTQEGEVVPWPWPAAENAAHIHASQGNVNGAASAANLLDGKYDSSDSRRYSKWFVQLSNVSGKNSVGVSNYTIDLDAGAGRCFAFDGYRLAPADVVGRNPMRWRLQTSADGKTWTTVHEQDQETPEKAWALKSTDTFLLKKPVHKGLSVSSGCITVRAGGTLSGPVVSPAGGRVTFEPGSFLEVTDEIPTFDGTVTGTVTPILPESLKNADHAVSVPLFGCAGDCSGLTLSLPEGWASYPSGGRMMLTNVVGPFTADLPEGFAAWKDLVLKDIHGFPVKPEDITRLQADRRITVLNISGTVTFADVAPACSLGSLTLTGTGTLTAEDPKALSAVSADTMTVEGDLRLGVCPTVGKPIVITDTSRLTVDVPEGQTLTSERRFFGPGTLVKTGTGTLNLKGQADHRPFDGSLRVELRGGDVSFSKKSSQDAYLGSTVYVFFDENRDGKADGNLKKGDCWVRFYKDSVQTFDVPAGIEDAQAFRTCLCGPGSLVKNGEGTLVLSHSDAGGSNRPYDGTTTLNDGTLRISSGSTKVNWYSALNSPNGKGRYVFSGKTEYLMHSTESTLNADFVTEAGTKLTINGDSKKLVIPSGKTLAMRGGYEHPSAGIIRLADGAVFDVAGGLGKIAPGRIAVGKVLNIVATQEQVDAGLTLLTGIDAAPETVTVRDPDGNVLAAGVKLEKDVLSLTVADPPTPEPEVVLPPEAGSLPDTVKDALTALAEQAGVKEITAIRPSENSVGKQAAEALSVFDGIAALVKGDGETAAVEVTYSFGVSAMKHVFIGDTPTLLVAATVQSSVGTAEYKEGTLLSAGSSDPEARALPPFEAQAPLSDEEITQYFGEKAAGTRYLKLTLRKDSTAELFRVSVSPAAK